VQARLGVGEREDGVVRFGAGHPQAQRAEVGVKGQGGGLDGR